MFKRICEKLGFNPTIPEDFPMPKIDKWTVDDNPSPFSVLTLEESMFLIKEGYM